MSLGPRDNATEKSANNDDYVMYLMVNKDLNMSPGKVAAQIGHVVEKLTTRLVKSLYEDMELSEYQIAYQKYLNSGHAKITLAVSEKEMKKFIGDVDAEHIIDEGRTEVPPNSLTVMGFIPSNNNKQRFKKYRLV